MIRTHLFKTRNALLWGAVISACCTMGAEKVPSLHELAQAGESKAIQIRLKSGALVDETDDDGRSILYVACLAGKADVATVLLKAGANPNKPARRKGNDTPLHAAAKYGHWKVVEILIHHKATVDARNRAQQTPLHFAAWNGRLLTVKALLTAGASPQALDHLGNGCLYYNHGIMPQAFASESTDFKAVAVELIGAGASVNVLAKTPKGYTPLMSACANAPADVVELLLNSGADPSAKLQNGATAYSIAEVKKRIDVMNLLKRKHVIH